MSEKQDRTRRRKFGKRNKTWPARAKKTAKNFLKRTIRPGFNSVLARYSIVGDPVVFDNDLFPWTKKFEENYDAIRHEAIRLGEIHDELPAFQEISPYQSRISHADFWKTAYLYGFGERMETLCRLCPVTTRLLDEVPDLQTACFSIMAPGTHVTKHSGVYKGLINYHLGVIIPKEREKTRMRVGDEIVHWEEGRSYVFDDTNPHEVWNDSGEERIVLLLQFLRPLRSPGRQLSQLFLSALRLSPYLRLPLARGKIFDEELRRVIEARGIAYPDDALASDART